MKPASLQWSTVEFERLRELDRSAFMNVAFNLGHAALEGSRDAAQSLLRALPAAQPMDWSENCDCTHDGNKREVNLSDAFGLALVSHLPAMRSSLFDRLEETFKGSGAWEFPLVTGYSWSSSHPFHKLAGYAMGARHEAVEIAEFLRPMVDEIQPHTEAAVCVDLRTPGNRKEKSNFYDKAGLHSHAVLNGNVQAILALEQAYPDFMKSMLGVTQSAQSSNGSKPKGNSLEVAAAGDSGEAIALMLEQIRKNSDEFKFLQEVASCLLIHVQGCGLRKDKGTSGFHDARVGVFHSIMAHGGKELLAQYEPLRDRWAAEGEGLVVDLDERSARNDRMGLIKKIENTASEAVHMSHPEAISAFMPIIAKQRHLIDDAKGAVASRLKEPIMSLHGLATEYQGGKEVSRATDYPRIFSAYDPEFLQGQLDRHGSHLLLKSAKSQSIDLAMHLVKMGVNPEAKGDNGWKSESYFKDAAKVQWRAFVSSQKAMAAVNSVMGNIEALMPRAAAGTRP